MKATELVTVMLIAPDHSLEETARIVSRALGLTLAKEITGRFEEYPAYFATQSGIEFSLLGPPAPEYDVREEPTDDYCLQISPAGPARMDSGLRDPIVGALCAAGLHVTAK